VPQIRIQPILAILLIQVLLSGILAGSLALWLGLTAGYSALLGGAIAVLPNAFLAARLLTPKAGANAHAMLRAAWLGELGKLALTALLFVVVFVTVRPLSALGLFGGFIAAQMVVLAGALLGGDSFGKENGKAKQ
jgi:ATP synthase protein I